MNQLALAVQAPNPLDIFNFEGNEVRTSLINGEPWFVCADVCAALDIGNNRMAISRLDEEDRGVTTTDTPSGRQEMGVINESGLYSLIFKSRKPEAIRFKRWVTSVLIPGIRKKEFVHVSEAQVPVSVLTQVLAAFETLRSDMADIRKELHDSRPQVPAIAAPVLSKPAREPVKSHLFSTAKLANKLGVTASRLNAIFEVLGYHTRVANRYAPTQKAMRMAEVVGKTIDRGQGARDKYLWKEEIISKIPKKYYM